MQVLSHDRIRLIGKGEGPTLLTKAVGRRLHQRDYRILNINIGNQRKREFGRNGSERNRTRFLRRFGHERGTSKMVRGRSPKKSKREDGRKAHNISARPRQTGQFAVSKERKAPLWEKIRVRGKEGKGGKRSPILA